MGDDKKVPFKPGFWVTSSNGEARLLGSRCGACGEVVFPKKNHDFCPHCHQKRLENVELSPFGTIASFSEVVQPPAGGYYKGPVPYYFGLVNTDDGARIETQLTGDVKKLAVGARVKLAIKTLYVDQEGNEVQIYSFQLA